MFIKTRTKHASKGRIELDVLKVFREVLIDVLSFRFGVVVLVLANLLVVLLVDGFSLVHTVIYGTHKQAHNKKRIKGFTVELESGKIKIWR